MQQLKKIEYIPAGYRATENTICISDITEWLRGDSRNIDRKIRNIIFYKKTKSWEYEREWRDIEFPGATDCPFARISALYFGTRCSGHDMASIFRLFNENDRPLLYKVIASKSSSRLTRKIITEESQFHEGVPSCCFEENLAELLSDDI